MDCRGYCSYMTGCYLDFVYYLIDSILKNVNFAILGPGTPFTLFETRNPKSENFLPTVCPPAKTSSVILSSERLWKLKSEFGPKSFLGSPGSYATSML